MGISFQKVFGYNISKAEGNSLSGVEYSQLWKVPVGGLKKFIAVFLLVAEDLFEKRL